MTSTPTPKVSFGPQHRQSEGPQETQVAVRIDGQEVGYLWTITTRRGAPYWFGNGELERRIGKLGTMYELATAKAMVRNRVAAA